MKRIFALALVAALLSITAPAHAVGGPTPQHPATKRISAHQARHVARFYVEHYVIPALPGPRASRVSPCTGGPFVWRCPTRYSGGDTVCRTTVAVWRHRDMYSLEQQGLRCAPRTR